MAKGETHPQLTLDVARNASKSVRVNPTVVKPKKQVARECHTSPMCMQCMMGAMTAGAGATGARTWLKHMAPRWLTPKRLRAVTFVLVGAALVASTVVLGGSSTA